jgi:hypothetical protein
MKDHAWTAGPVKVKLGGVHSEAWLQEVASDLQGQFLTHGLSNMPSWKFMEDSDFIQWMLEHEPTLKYVANFLAKRGAIKEVEPGWWEGDQSQLFQGPRARRAPRLQKAPKKSKKKSKGPF